MKKSNLGNSLRDLISKKNIGVIGSNTGYADFFLNYGESLISVFQCKMSQTKLDNFSNNILILRSSFKDVI